MSRLTFNNIYQYLQSRGIKCILSTRGVKVYTNYSHLGSFCAVQGQCIFRGSVPIEFQITQSRLHNLLNLFECDTVALFNDNSIEYICKIKAIKPIKETPDE